jgi:hypothetical protein
MVHERPRVLVLLLLLVATGGQPEAAYGRTPRCIRACPRTVDRCLDVTAASTLKKGCRRALRRRCRNVGLEGSWVFEGPDGETPFAEAFSIRNDGNELVADVPWFFPPTSQVSMPTPDGFSLVSGGRFAYVYSSFELSVRNLLRGHGDAAYHPQATCDVCAPPTMTDATRVGTVSKVLCSLDVVTSTSSTSTSTTGTTGTTSSTDPYRATLQRCDDGIDNPGQCPALGICPPGHACIPEPEGDCRCHPRCAGTIDACDGSCPPGGQCYAGLWNAAGSCVCR